MAPLYHFDEFVLDPNAFVLMRAGRIVPLEPKAFDLLRYLLDHSNAVVTKRELLDALWKDAAVTENVLARLIVMIRRALQDDPRQARYVKTVPRRGYTFIASSLRKITAPRVPVTTLDRAAATPAAIAVLPFVDTSGDPAAVYFSDGISEDILNALSHDHALRVAARSSSFVFRGGTIDVREIAERLRVEFVLDGSVRRTEDRVRVTAQLIDAATGYQVWSRQFDRNLTDIFAVQDEIATAVASSIRETFRHDGDQSAIGAASPVRPRRPPLNMEAYESFLKGRYLTHQRFVVMAEARDCFRRAIALSPSFAPAYAALAENYGLCALYSALPPTEAFLAMRRFAEEACANDPDSAEPHRLLAAVALWFEWNVEASERHLREALALEPDHVGALTFAATLSAQRRQPEHAWARIEQALRLDPLGAETRTWSLVVAWLTGEFEHQIRESTQLIAEHPGYGDAYRWRSMAYTICGDYARARADLETFGALTNGHLYTAVGLGTVAARESKTAEAREIIDRLLEQSTRAWVPPMAFGQIEQQLGNYDAALDWYERAYRTRDFLLSALHVDPQFRLLPPGQAHPIDKHPRWETLLDKIGIASTASGKLQPTSGPGA